MVTIGCGFTMKTTQSKKKFHRILSVKEISIPERNILYSYSMKEEKITKSA
jgi:hypothetical protein